MINLQQLRMLLAVREHGSLTRAADALHYGVPTVAHHIRTWNMIHGLVAEGLGCALTTAAPVDQDFEVELRDTADRLGERRVSFVTTKGARPAAVGWLGEILQRVAVLRVQAVSN